MNKSISTITVLLATTLPTLACSHPKAVRGEDVQGLDDQAMSTGLDRRDLQKLLSENMTALESSAVVKRWESEQQPTLSVLPFRNETSEHIDSSLDALISDVETTLINAGHVRVVSIEQQAGLMAEIKKQQGDGFDQGQTTQWGKQLGAKYIVTGKVYTSDEVNSDNERRVQYYLFMQVLDVETGQILFQNKAALTKALI
jgi:penicillin-binding protein activator